MNKLNLEITSKALSDIEVITDYIAQDNKSAARKLSKDFYKHFENLCKHPNLGKEKESFIYLNAKFYIIKRNYIIVYRLIEKNTLRILRILNSCQDICSLLQADLCYNLGYEEEL